MKISLKSVRFCTILEGSMVEMSYQIELAEGEKIGSWILERDRQIAEMGGLPPIAGDTGKAEKGEKYPCSDCGKEFIPQFKDKPNPKRPIYCDACYSKRKQK